MQDTSANSRARTLGWLCVLVAGIVLLTPGLFSFPPVDRDESRFAQASRQMLEGGALSDYIVPKIQDTPRLNKPPLIYWLQAGSVSFARSTGLYEATESLGRLPTYGIGWHRVPSVLCAILAGLFTYLLALRVLNGHVLGATLAGMCLLACPIVLWDARQARADQLLLACTMLAMLGLHTIWRNRNEPMRDWKGFFALWIGLGLGVMAKGPITPMVCGLTVIALSLTGDGWRWVRRTRPLPGIVIALLMIAPWVALVMREVGAGEYLRIVYDETIGRSGSAAEGHWGPPGYHLVLLPLMLWPISLVIADAVVGAFKSARPTETSGGRFVRIMARLRGMEPDTRFLLAWIVPGWIVFELVSTKLPHYVLPLYPALAVLGASRAVSSVKRTGLIGVAIWGFLGLCLVSLPGVGLEFLGFGGSGSEWAVAMGLGGLGVVALLAALVLVTRRAAATGLFCAVVAIGTVSSGLFGIVLPGVTEPWVTARVVREIDRIDPGWARPLVCVGYQEDSLVFSTCGRIERVGGNGAAPWLAEHADGLMVIEAGKLDRIGGLEAVRVLGEVSGFNYSNGEDVTVLLIERYDYAGEGG